MHTYTQSQNQQVNRRHIKITYLLTAPEPARDNWVQKWCCVCLRVGLYYDRCRIAVGERS